MEGKQTRSVVKKNRECVISSLFSFPSPHLFLSCLSFLNSSTHSYLKISSSVGILLSYLSPVAISLRGWGRREKTEERAKEMEDKKVEELKSKDGQKKKEEVKQKKCESKARCNE